VIEMTLTDAEEALRAALERHEQARLHYSKMALEFAGEVVEGEPFVEGLYALGVARAAVDAARLRLKLMDAEGSVLEIQAEHRRRHPLSPEITERINDLGTLEEAESEAVEAEVRFQEADRNSKEFSEHFAAGRIGVGDMFLVLKELAEADAERRIVQARVSLIKLMKEKEQSGLEEVSGEQGTDDSIVM
jgi:hypothetical protein